MKFALLSKELVNPTATNLSSGEMKTHEAESATPTRIQNFTEHYDQTENFDY